MRKPTFKTLLTAVAITVGFAAPVSAPAANAFNPQPEPSLKKSFVSPGTWNAGAVMPLPSLKKGFVLPGTRKASPTLPLPPPKKTLKRKF